MFEVEKYNSILCQYQDEICIKDETYAVGIKRSNCALDLT